MKKNKRSRERSESAPAAEEEASTEKAVPEDELPAEPRKKKKKVPAPPVEGAISKRQMKREKHAQRMAEAEAASHKAIALQALSYLSLWKHNRNEWKFNKVKQIWLCRHKFEPDKIPDELWQPFLEYFAKAAGGVKTLLCEDSEKVIKQMEERLEKGETADGPSKFAYERARDILQNIN